MLTVTYLFYFYTMDISSLFKVPTYKSENINSQLSLIYPKLNNNLTLHLHIKYTFYLD